MQVAYIGHDMYVQHSYRTGPKEVVQRLVEPFCRNEAASYMQKFSPCQPTSMDEKCG